MSATASRWRGIFTVFRKEFLENLRDKRTLLSALIIGPVFGPLLFAGLTQFSVKQSDAASDEPVKIAISHSERAPNLIAWLSARGMDVTPVMLDEDAARAALRHDSRQPDDHRSVPGRVRALSRGGVGLGGGRRRVARALPSARERGILRRAPATRGRAALTPR